MASDFELLDVVVTGHLATVVIDNPPINLMTRGLYSELRASCIELEEDPDLTVVVFRSANPDFFIAHFDVETILQFPADGEAARDDSLNPFHEMCERVRTMNKATIAQIEGRVGGGGSEFAASMDMRFGVERKTVINQMEVPIGILPGGSGTQRLPRLVGRGRAMEIVLGGNDLDAQTAERWGYLNRIFAADEIGPWVSEFAKRIAGLREEAVRLGKAAVLAADLPLLDGLREEAFLFQQLLRTEDAQTYMQRFLEIGGQTPEGEMRMGELADELSRTEKT